VPRTDAVLADARLVAAEQRLGRALVKDAVRQAQEAARRGDVSPDAVADLAVAALPTVPTTARAVLNATGVVLHTNLGRAPLSPSATDALVVAAGYVDVEFDLATGARARRGRGALDALRSALPDTGDVLVVNNGAAALVLAATALAQGREIVVSRGEMVEIGDGFRIPDLVASTGARLREVGTTNRTTLADYADAIGADTGFVLKVHPSNFRVEGFTSSVGVSELATLGVPVVADIGSGLLRPDRLLDDEPDATTWLRSGADLVTASGDKLLGGPQAGIVAGRADLVERLRRHPLARALRVDKLTLAALEATLRGPAPPASAMLHADADGLRSRAEAIAAELVAAGVPASVEPSDGAVGGGGAPGLALPGWAVVVPIGLVERLRCGAVPVVGRVERGRCLLDVRTVPPERDDDLRAAVVAAAGVTGDEPRGGR
jgi:L-seryl-tRNA(Ser) seleniumtransferase